MCKAQCANIWSIRKDWIYYRRFLRTHQYPRLRIEIRCSLFISALGRANIQERWDLRSWYYGAVRRVGKAHKLISPAPTPKKNRLLIIGSRSYIMEQALNVSRNIALYIPRTSNLNQVAKMVPKGERVQAIHYCIQRRSKVRPFMIIWRCVRRFYPSNSFYQALTVYFGNLSNLEVSKGI